MNVPTSIQHVLDSHNICYNLACLTSAPPLLIDATKMDQQAHQHTARAHVLETTTGKKLLAIIDNQSIVNLDAVATQLNEHYTPITVDELATYVKKLGLESIAALPKLGDLPTIVDSRLLEYEQLLLPIGIGDQYEVLEQTSFHQLVSATTISNIATPLTPLNTAMPTADDVPHIMHSVDLFTELRIKQRLEETLELPPLPVTAQSIMQLRVNPDADISDLSDIVELDPSLASQVVSWAASPYYSAPGTIKSIHDAIVRVLGFDMVLNLALGLSLGSTLKMPTKGPHSTTPYWQQSVYVAACAEAIISCMPRALRPNYGSAYLAGLLHNFGYLIIAEIFNAQFIKICQHIDANPHASVQAIERHIIGVDRDQLASWLMVFWHMPTEVCIAIRQHNNPDYDGDYWQYALVIHTATKLLREQGIITGTSAEPIDENVFVRLQLERSEAEEAISKILESQEELQAIAQQMET